MGITNMIATIPGFLSPSVVGILTQGNVSNKKLSCCCDSRSYCMQ